MIYCTNCAKFSGKFSFLWLLNNSHVFVLYQEQFAKCNFLRKKTYFKVSLIIEIFMFLSDVSSLTRKTPMRAESVSKWGIFWEKWLQVKKEQHTNQSYKINLLNAKFPPSKFHTYLGSNSLVPNQSLKRFSKVWCDKQIVCKARVINPLSQCNSC